MDDRQLDFAVLGHQENWSQITRFVNGMRDSNFEPLPEAKVRDIFPYLPPMNLFNVRVTSQTGVQINGVYIETFLAPDELSRRNVLKNIKKIKAAMHHAQKLKAPVVSLGGFTSIILEGKIPVSDISHSTVFTTGNTLTAALIVQGIESAVGRRNVLLRDSTILIIGATGDIGSACSQYFYPRIRQLILCARNERRLNSLAKQIAPRFERIRCTTNYKEYLADADIVLCVASTTGLQLRDCKPGAIICDAGYPKNLESDISIRDNVFLFHGGMGYLKEGYEFIPDYSEHFYNFPTPNTIHGCLLEAMTLAFEQKYVPYSMGRGNISIDNMHEISAMSAKHGIRLAPLFNGKGLC